MILCENLTLGYERHPAVHHLSLMLPSGGLMAIVGPNGAGKSTLLKALAGEIKPLEGQIRITGHAAPPVLAYLPQQAEFELGFPLSVFEFVVMGFWEQIGAFRGLFADHHEKIRRALREVGLDGFENRPMNTLSGGQLQRARFARLALQDADIVLLDEPFLALDSHTTQALLTQLLAWHEQGKTLIVVLHDLAMVRRAFPLCLLLAREPIAIGPTADVLCQTHLQKAHLPSEAFDDHAAECRRPPHGG
jgi:zinc/manganese transport system ATP-binding protein